MIRRNVTWRELSWFAFDVLTAGPNVLAVAWLWFRRCAASEEPRPGDG